MDDDVQVCHWSAVRTDDPKERILKFHNFRSDLLMTLDVRTDDPKERILK